MKNFIWDFDGTLFDTYTHTVTVLHRYMVELGRNYDYDEMYAASRITLGAVRKLCNVSDEEWKEFYRREGEIDMPPTANPYPNTEKFLQAVKNNGGENFIYTHRDAVTFKYLKKWDMVKYFGGFITSENNFPSKPAPDAILHLMKRYNLHPEETVMVGDREIDILSGKNAGIHACLFTEGNPDTEITKNTQADYIADSMLSLGRLFFPTIF